VPLPDIVAEQVLDELGILSAEDLLLLDHIAWARGATVRYESLKGAEARIAVVGDRAIITVSTGIDNAGRQRFGVAHELGHFEIRRVLSGVVFCKSKQIGPGRRLETSDDPEYMANRFASTLLLPRRFFASLCAGEIPSLDLAAQLADKFSVSLTAAGLRLIEFTDEPCSLVYSSGGQIQWFQASDEWDLIKEDTGIFVNVHARVDETTVAAQHFRGAGRDTPKRVRAKAWLRPGRYSRYAEIVEQSWAVPTQDGVLSLLVIDDDITEDDDPLPGLP
jgi:hypothetical protein